MTASSPGASGLGPDGLGPMNEEQPYPGEPAGAELNRQEEELAAYIAATAGDEPFDEAGDQPSDEDTEMWEDGESWLDQDPPEAGEQEFASGSVLDALGPGPTLTAALDDVMSDGLDQLTDDALAGVMLAFRRCESRAAAGLWAASAELARRREAEDPRAAEHLDNEAALLLAWTRPAARRLLTTGVSLARLPATRAALWLSLIHI